MGTVPDAKFEAFKFVRLTPDTAGSCEEPSSATSWLTPLNTLPRAVTDVKSILIAAVEPLMVRFMASLSEIDSVGLDLIPSKLLKTSTGLPEPPPAEPLLAEVARP